MHLHSNASTPPKQRARIQQSPLPYRTLATQYQVALATIHRWKHRADPQDRSCRPLRGATAFRPEDEALIVFLRAQGLSLDALQDVLLALRPQVSRASLHRLLVRRGLNRRPRPARETPGTFKVYPPGYVHIDCLHLPRLDGLRQYGFVAVDRATRLVYLRCYPRRTQDAACDFLRRCVAFFPFRVTIVLTDNGGEFARMVLRRHGRRALTHGHRFTLLCEHLGIAHRRIRPYHPQTNGLVERMNGLIKADTVDRIRYPSHAAVRAALAGWLQVYNCARPHRQLGRQTPYQAVCTWYQREPERFIKEPSHLLRFCSQGGET